MRVQNLLSPFGGPEELAAACSAAGTCGASAGRERPAFQEGVGFRGAICECVFPVLFGCDLSMFVSCDNT